MAKKTKKIIPVKKSKTLVAKYIGDTEKYFPAFKKIVNKGDFVAEMSIDEAKTRSDFIVIYKED